MPVREPVLAVSNVPVLTVLAVSNVPVSVSTGPVVNFPIGLETMNFDRRKKKKEGLPA